MGVFWIHIYMGNKCLAILVWARGYTKDMTWEAKDNKQEGVGIGMGVKGWRWTRWREMKNIVRWGNVQQGA